MKRSLLLLVFGTFAALANPGCGQAQGSGTKTNWLRSCNTTSECGDSASCVCGLCTTPCEAATGCDGGVCGSEIATGAQCEGHAAVTTRLCLPEPATTPTACIELPLTISDKLGEAPPLTCDIPGALICESFDAPLPSTTSTWVENDAEGALQECVVSSGSGALVERVVDDGRIQTRFRLPTPIASGALHVRFYFRVSSASVLPEQVTLFEFWDQETDPANQTSLVLTAAGDLAAYVSPGNHALRATPPVALPQDTWVCIELADQLGTGDGSLTVAVDGNTVLSGTNLTTMHPNPLIVAVLQSQPTPGSTGDQAELFFDDLVVGTEPIGCH
jgi:hypothetical protein